HAPSGCHSRSSATIKDSSKQDQQWRTRRLGKRTNANPARSRPVFLEFLLPAMSAQVRSNVVLLLWVKAGWLLPVFKSPWPHLIAVKRKDLAVAAQDKLAAATPSCGRRGRESLPN